MLNKTATQPHEEQVLRTDLAFVKVALRTLKLTNREKSTMLQKLARMHGVPTPHLASFLADNLLE